MGKGFSSVHCDDNVLSNHAIHAGKVLERRKALSKFVLACSLSDASTVCLRLSAARLVQRLWDRICEAVLVPHVLLFLFLDSVSCDRFMDGKRNPPYQ